MYQASGKHRKARINKDTLISGKIYFKKKSYYHR